MPALSETKNATEFSLPMGKVEWLILLSTAITRIIDNIKYNFRIIHYKYLTIL